MAFPLTIKGRIKTNLPKNDDSFFELFINYLSSSLIQEGAKLNDRNGRKINFKRPFVIIEWNWKPFVCISSGDLELINQGSNTWLYYKINFIPLYIIATILCFILLLAKISSIQISPDLSHIFFIWAFLIVGNLIFYTLIFRRFIKKNYKGFLSTYNESAT